VRIDWAIPCRYVEVNGNLATIVGGGIDTYWPPDFPAELQVLFALRFVASSEDIGPGKSHTMMVRLHDPEMNLISEVAVTMQDLAVSGGRPGWDVGLIVPMVQILRIESPGIYTVDLAIEGRIHTVAVAVEQGPPPAS
jgi:hypothetical protein